MHPFKLKKTRINPYFYYKNCRDCQSPVLKSEGKKGYCENCGWHFYVHTVEEVQDSHPWPDELKLSELGLSGLW